MVLPLAISRLSSKSPSRRRDGSKSPSSGPTLVEALRTNPFRTSSREPQVEHGQDHVDQGLRELNTALLTLAQLYPDVKIEVLRELLTRFDGKSRVEISAEQLWKYKAEWVKGRYQVPPRNPGEPIPKEDQFRGPEYVSAVTKAFTLEFRALSKSTVDAVLAEKNFSYTCARPVLQNLSNRTWRVTIGNLFKKKKLRDDIPLCLFVDQKVDQYNPSLHATGSAELDRELHDLFVDPLVQQNKKSKEAADIEYARTINQQQAEEASALYECEVCYCDSTFEAIATCSTGEHFICYSCIRRTIHEALFGQGWLKSVNPSFGTMICVTPSAGDDCLGFIPHYLVRQAILTETAGMETWIKFEERLAQDDLQKSQMKVASCPFCPYAEAEQGYSTKDRKRFTWRPKRGNTFTTFVCLVTLFNLLPLLLVPLILTYILLSILRTNYFQQSLYNLSARARNPRFTCQSERCGRTSCLTCQKPWHDPHTCHEPLLLSLRTTVEAARTAAVKRTCPRCGTSFVKSSGCNKLTCTCGYAMCYICRKNIGKNGMESGEGYRHFCEHFRPTPGVQCTECSKCDLYQEEDADSVVRAAGEEAERQWRIREGMVGVKGLDEAAGNEASTAEFFYRFWNGDWTVQDVVDWAMDWLIVVSDDAP